MIEKKIETANNIGAAAEKALDFVEKIIAGPIMEGTGILTDKVEFWRFKNRVKILQKAIEFLKERGIKTPKNMPLKDLTTLLEYSSFEEDEEMQDNWAKLLANTLNPENKFNACHIFSQVLNQVSIEEINMLRFMFNKCFMMSSEHRPYFEKSDLLRYKFAHYELTLLLFDNLMRLRLIEEQPPKLKEQYYDDTSSYDPLPESEIVSSDNYRLSKFGVELMKMID